MPSAVLGTDGVLAITGTSGTDAFTIGRMKGSLYVTEELGNAHEVTRNFPVASISAITIDGMGGSDLVTVQSIQALIPVNMHGTFAVPTHYQVSICPAIRDLSYLLGSVVTIDSPGGAAVHLYDSGNAFGTTYTVAVDSVSRPFGGTVRFTRSVLRNPVSLTLDTAHGSSTVNVVGTPTELVINAASSAGGNVENFNSFAGPGAVTVNAGAGDAINMSTGYFAPRSVTVNGQGGTGVLTLDATYGTSDDCQLRDGAVTITNPFDHSRQSIAYTGLASVVLRGSSDHQTFTVDGAFSCPVRIAASDSYDSGAYDRLTVVHYPGSVFHITGRDAGDVNGMVAFDGIGNLTGDTGTTRFAFADGQSITGTPSGFGPVVLDYSAYTSAVNVNLATGAATGIAPVARFSVQEVIGGSGNDTLIGDSTADQILRGGPGDDYLHAGSDTAILLGEDGNDTLVGGPGRNLLIGGAGADGIVAGSGGDIIISGTTAFDANDAALRELVDAWADPSANYAQRTARLQAGVGTDNVALTSATVFADGAVNTIVVTGSDNWYWTNPWTWGWHLGRQVLEPGDAFVYPVNFSMR